MMPNGEHLGDEIELYALGALEDAERERIDAHAGQCDECASRLGRAEATVTQMIDATLAPAAAPRTMIARIPAAPVVAGPPHPLRGIWRRSATWSVAAAAAFALAAAGFGRQNAQLRSDLVDDGAAFHAMIDSHFSHAQFLSPDGAPLAAKVVYERHGGWYEVLAHGIDPHSRIVVVRGTTSTVYPGAFAMRDDVLTLALPALGAVTEFRLLDSRGRTRGQVRPQLIAVGK